MWKPLLNDLLDLDDVTLDTSNGECGLCCPRGGLCCPSDPLDEVMECVPFSDDALLRVGCSPAPPLLQSEECYGGEESGDAVAVEDSASELDMSWSAATAPAPSSADAKPPPSSLLWPAPPQPPPWLPSPLLCAWPRSSRRSRRRRRPAAAVWQWHCPSPLYRSTGDEVHEHTGKTHEQYNPRNKLSSVVNGDRRCLPAPQRISAPAPDHHSGGINPDKKRHHGELSGDNGAARRRSPPPPRRRTRNRQANRQCSHCKALKTPQWRAGPAGPGTLCNACGIRFNTRLGGLLETYRPAGSPGFRSGEYSNRHKRAVKLKEEEEIEKALLAAVSIASCDRVSIQN